ncbi:hypothetical protein [Vannielia litorea]|uniref:hypothetical protein n=1 Tax=Vannielia litorea TaxID=1217970 RepID=UPI001C948D26|nr:hypothetical protein [Vannielia litorea]MBY6047642.1 hypothetical protein [Vannielia litorea]MBY6075056.1 hypothetical protein [Vannielia litorea]
MFPKPHAVAAALLCLSGSVATAPASFAAEGKRCTGSTTYASVDALCGCAVVTQSFIRHVQRSPQFPELLGAIESQCPKLAIVLTDLPTAAIDLGSGDGSDGPGGSASTGGDGGGDTGNTGGTDGGSDEGDTGDGGTGGDTTDGSGDPGGSSGNPGNDKDVGKAGEAPSKGDWGGGSKGKSDGGKGGGKGKGKGH